MRKLVVKEKALLLEYLYRTLSDTKRTRIKDYLQKNAISVNGDKTTRFDYPLTPGNVIEIETDARVLKNVQPEFGVQVVYEDDAMMVIYKPSGLLTIATERIQGVNAFTSVNEYLNLRETPSLSLKLSVKRKDKTDLAIRKKQIFLVHRLDRDTSGLLMFAKNESVKFKLQGTWEQVQKKYWAVVEGTPKEEMGTMQSFLTENKILRVYSGPKEAASKWAVTHYRVVRSNDQYALLDIDLETGRKHQIRVHLADLKHPVAGDKDYGAKTNPAGRLCLHAYSLQFPHPITEKMMALETKMPTEFEKIFA
ncbi:MAG: RluA family pseudouridine synthase [Candidatus Omnitrophica bacterium]|nr:RluA family pseudouridine synthase [Candidatus Omnitrophota bacterium]